MILSNVCQWYITQYARESVKEHILSVVQNNLISLYWFRFIPTIVDLELVLKVSRVYLFITLMNFFTDDEVSHVTKTKMKLLS